MMDSTFDPLDLLADLRSRWLVVATSCGVALAVALGISLVIPEKYTATAQVLIQAPGGNDPRAATAVSPVYLESLKAYERVASSDTLFVRALEHVQIGEAGVGRSVESLKKSVLRVSKPANTAILEISATMADPKKAQALAQYVAEQTAEMSRTIGSLGDGDTTREFHTQLDAASARLTKARGAAAALRGSEPVSSLESQLEANADLKLKVEKDLSAVRAEAAGYAAETQPGGSDADFLRRMTASAQARIAALEDQRRDLVKTLTEQGVQLETWKSRHASMEAEETAAQAAFETANARMNEVMTAAQFRGERLRVIDPGIVPQEPSSPNVPLNLLAALVLALAGSVSYLVTTFGYRRARQARVEGSTEPLYSFGR